MKHHCTSCFLLPVSPVLRSDRYQCPAHRPDSAPDPRSFIRCRSAQTQKIFHFLPYPLSKSRCCSPSPLSRSSCLLLATSPVELVPYRYRQPAYMVDGTRLARMPRPCSLANPSSSPGSSLVCRRSARILRSTAFSASGNLAPAPQPVLDRTFASARAQ